MHSAEEPNSFFGGMAANSWNSKDDYIKDPANSDENLTSSPLNKVVIFIKNINRALFNYDIADSPRSNLKITIAKE